MVGRESGWERREWRGKPKVKLLDVLTAAMCVVPPGRRRSPPGGLAAVRSGERAAPGRAGERQSARERRGRRPSVSTGRRARPRHRVWRAGDVHGRPLAAPVRRRRGRSAARAEHGVAIRGPGPLLCRPQTNGPGPGGDVQSLCFSRGRVGRSRPVFLLVAWPSLDPNPEGQEKLRKEVLQAGKPLHESVNRHWAPSRHTCATSTEFARQPRQWTLPNGAKLAQRRLVTALVSPHAQAKRTSRAHGFAAHRAQTRRVARAPIFPLGAHLNNTASRGPPRALGPHRARN